MTSDADVREGVYRMRETREQWTKPGFEIVGFGREDVIRTSGNITKTETGSGDTVNWNDLFD